MLVSAKIYRLRRAEDNGCFHQPISLMLGPLNKVEADGQASTAGPRADVLVRETSSSGGASPRHDHGHNRSYTITIITLSPSKVGADGRTLTSPRAHVFRRPTASGGASSQQDHDHHRSIPSLSSPSSSSSLATSSSSLSSLL